jgi:II/X family phage/plasmid replication protein
MLDTVKITSPAIGEDLAARVEGFLRTRRGIENSTGELLYEIVGGEVKLDGSYDHRVRVAVLRKRYRWIPGEGSRRGETVVEDSPPYLEVEGSVHKAMVGHNCWGGPVDIARACFWLVVDLGERLDCWLPYAMDWEVRRLDWANVYDLGSSEAVGDYCWALNQAAYPRRRAARYGRTGIHFGGDTTAVKLYNKGVEFRRHDLMRIRRAVSGGAIVAREIAERADSLLRVEVSIKARVLDEAYGMATVAKVSAEWASMVWEREVQKMAREARSDVEVVRMAAAVKERLQGHYTRRQAATLYATWVAFSTIGEESAAADMARSTFYLHRSQLTAAGCSWRGTDVQLIEAAPRFGDFAPSLIDRRRLVEVHPRVLALLGRAA